MDNNKRTSDLLLLYLFLFDIICYYKSRERMSGVNYPAVSDRVFDPRGIRQMQEYV